MKNLFLALVCIAPLFFYSCKKETIIIQQCDKAENLLVLRLNKEFQPLDYKEFTIENLQHVNDSLPITIGHVALPDDESYVYYTIGAEQDTIVKILSNSFVYPEFIDEKTNFTELNYPWSYIEDNMYSLGTNNIDLKELWETIKHTEIINVYRIFYPDAKFAVSREIIHHYDAELDLSIPRVYYLLFVG